MFLSALFFCLTIYFLALQRPTAFMLEEDEEEEEEEEKAEDRELSKAILEMLHISKLSTHQQAKPHPYMTQVYQWLETQKDTSEADGTLVQSFRSTQDVKYNTPGWIWFDTSPLSPFMTFAELVLLRKTLHFTPLSVTVTVHSLAPGAGHLSVSGPLTEHLLNLAQLSPSGYDVFDVTAAITHRSDRLGFQLRFGDEGGSLVLHEALTQSFYCLDSSICTKPLLVVYKTKPVGRDQ